MSLRKRDFATNKIVVNLNKEVKSKTPTFTIKRRIKHYAASLDGW